MSLADRELNETGYETLLYFSNHSLVHFILVHFRFVHIINIILENLKIVCQELFKVLHSERYDYNL